MIDVLLLIYFIGIAAAFVLQIKMIHRYTAEEIYNTKKRELQIVGFIIVMVFWLLFMVIYIKELLE